jgi:hypothetical protein
MSAGSGFVNVQHCRLPPFGLPGNTAAMARSRPPEIALEMASAADLHALIPRAREDDQAPGIDPEMLAEMQRHADRVAAEAPPFSPSVRARVRELLVVAAGLHEPDAAPCTSRAQARATDPGTPGLAHPRE